MAAKSRGLSPVPFVAVVNKFDKLFFPTFGVTDETPQEEEEEEDGLSFVAPVVASLCRLRCGIRQRMDCWYM